MNDHALRVLEFDRLREIVAGYARSEAGRRAVAGGRPAADAATVAELLAETREYLGLLRSGEHPPLDGIQDVRSAVDRLAVAGAALQPPELLGIASTLAAGRRIKAYFDRIGAADAGAGGGSARRVPAAPLLAGRAGRMTPLKHLEEAIHTVLDASGEVKDSASPDLRRIRKLAGRVRDEILGRMDRILRSIEAQQIVQEQVITVRDDRYVIPLKPNFRQSIRGVVHGQSGSRATLFVEPLEVLEQNNRLAELRMEERDEIERILQELAAQLAAERQPIASMLDVLEHLDAAQARSRFGFDLGGVVPELSGERRLRLTAARHPLLVWKQRTGGGRPVVPNDISLSGDRKALIISGPNAGGKTAVLKTIGLLSLMAQAGMPVTADEGSELPVFSDVFADIGDEQSLEQDLSTFSSHMRSVAEILRSARQDALVLLDELGSGTDPAEGAALGSAVLARLLESGCLTVATTHHSSLKLFGARTEGAVNGAMEFDPGTLKPTYRFIPGRPGRSYGLDMADRLGVPGAVVRDARSRLAADETALDRLLEQVEQDARLMRIDREAAESERLTAQKLKQEAEAAARTAAEASRDIRTRAQQDAREVLAALRQKFKELSRAADIGRAAVQAERRTVDALVQRLAGEEIEQQQAGAHEGREFHAGERVRLPKLNKTGIVLFVHKDALEVDAGGIRLRIPAGDAVPLADAAPQAGRGAASGWGADLQEREGAVDRLLLLGKRVDEALDAVDRFLDRAGIDGLRQVTVIHGLGSGALKEAVTAFLKAHPLVASIRPGEPAEGGAGVTVAELKR
jgi:DNA mismatch repair protein MutS2